jgi:hypothetical protein
MFRETFGGRRNFRKGKLIFIDFFPIEQIFKDFPISSLILTCHRYRYKALKNYDEKNARNKQKNYCQQNSGEE